MERLGSCLWCSSSSFASHNLYSFLMSKAPSSKNKHPIWIEQARRDICLCIDCMEEYHHAVKNAFVTDRRFSEKRPEMMKLVYERNICRLKDYLTTTLNELDNGSSSSLSDGGDDDYFTSTQRAVDIRKKLECSLIETLKYPRFLLNPHINDLFVRGFTLLDDAEKLIEVSSKYPGIYLLLVHPNQKVRRWAMESVKTLGLLDWDDYDDMEDIISWIINVLTFDLFQEPVQDVGVAAWNEDTLVQLPQHLFVRGSLKDYWLGVCMLITSMDSSCIRLRLMCGTSDHKQLINLISSALEYENNLTVTGGPSQVTANQANSSIFLPALQCLMVLLERLSSRFWQYSSKDSASLLRDILDNPFFHHELKKWQHCASTPEISDDESNTDLAAATDSQMVYESSRSSAGKLVGKRPFSSTHNVHSSALTWMVPFVHSLLDFGEQMADTVKILLKWLNSIYTSLLAENCTFDLPSGVQISSSSDCDISKLATSPLANELLWRLSQIVELLYAKEFAVFLLNCKDYWLPQITSTICVSCRNSALQNLSSVSHIVTLLISILSSPISKQLPKSKDLCSVLVRVRDCIQLDQPVVERVSKKALSQLLTTLLSKCPSLQERASLFESSNAPLTTDHPDDDLTPVNDDSSTSSCSEQKDNTPSKRQNLQNVIDKIYEHTAASPSTPSNSGTIKKKLNLSLSKRPHISRLSNVADSPRAYKLISSGSNCPSLDGSMLSYMDTSESGAIHNIPLSKLAPKKLALSLSKSKKPMLRSSESTDELNVTEQSSDQRSSSTIGTPHRPIGRKSLKLKKRASKPIVSSEESTDECTPAKKHLSPQIFMKSQDSSKTISFREGKKMKPPNILSSSKFDVSDAPSIASTSSNQGPSKIIKPNSKQKELKEKSSVKARPLPISPKPSNHKSPSPPKKKKKRIVCKSISSSKDSSDDFESSDVSYAPCSNSSQTQLKINLVKHVPPARKQPSTTKAIPSPRGLERSSEPRKALPVHPRSDLNKRSSNTSSAEKVSAKKVPFISELLFRNPDLYTASSDSSDEKKGKLHQLEAAPQSVQSSSSSVMEQDDLILNDEDVCLKPFKKERHVKVSQKDSTIGTTLPKSELDVSDASELDVTTTIESPFQSEVPTSKPEILVISSDSASEADNDNRVRHLKVQIPLALLQKRKNLKLTLSKAVSLPKQAPTSVSLNQTDELKDDEIPEESLSSFERVNRWINSGSVPEELKGSETLKLRDASGTSSDSNIDVVDIEDQSSQSSPFCYESAFHHVLAMEQSVDKDKEESSTPSLGSSELIVRTPCPLVDRDKEESSSSSLGSIELLARTPCPLSKKRYRLPSSIPHTQHSYAPLKKCSVAVMRCDQLAIKELRRKRLRQLKLKENEKRERNLKLKLEESREKHLQKVSLEEPRQKEQRQSQNQLDVQNHKQVYNIAKSKPTAKKMFSLPRVMDDIFNDSSDSSISTTSSTYVKSKSKLKTASRKSSKHAETSRHSKNENKVSTKLIKMPGMEYHGQKIVLEKTALASKKDAVSSTRGKSAQPSSRPHEHNKYRIPIIKEKSSSEPKLKSTAAETYKENAVLSLPSKSAITDPCHKSTEQHQASTVTTLPPAQLLALADLVQQQQMATSKHSHKPPSRFTSRLNYDLDLSAATPRMPGSTSTQAAHSVPVCNSRKTPTIEIYPSRMRKMDDLFLNVLSWNPTDHLYPQTAQNGRLIAPKLQVDPKHIPQTFRSYEQYCEVFTPLLLLEIWECVYSDIQSTTVPKPPPCSAKITSLSPSANPRIQQLKCTVLISQKHAKDNAHPSEHDLVILNFEDSYPLSSHMYNSVSITSQHLFALVDSISKSPLGNSSTENNKLTLNLKVCGLHGVPSSMLENYKVKITVASSLKSAVRQWNGLINFHRSQLVRDILYPRGGVYFGLDPAFAVTRNDDQEERPGCKFNHSQMRAMRSITHSVCEPFAIPRICLLQGPPGTGKTRTIFGLIQELLRELRPDKYAAPLLPGQQHQAQQGRPHILVCAPSNAGVDEIARRLMNEGMVMNSSHNSREAGPDQAQQGGGYKVVRTGQQARIHPDILPISLDALVKKNLAKGRSSEQESTKANELLKEIETITEIIESRRKELKLLYTRKEFDPSAKEQITKVEFELAMKEQNVQQLHQQRRTIRVRERDSSREAALVRKRILVNADIVCATLQGCGSSVVMDCLNQNPLHFSCIIVDEASQCTELDTLIPLCYSCSKLVLVGDPMQLPATVKSQRATAHLFKQSLFERVFKHFSEFPPSENPIKMLTMQYRMLPEICHFPSSHFYKGKLQTSSSVARSGESLKFKPFVLFDVKLGTETSCNDGSICNLKECEVMIELLIHLISHFEVAPSSIGIITPYKAQERRIKQELKKRSLLRALPIEVGTVDSFQGREKDIIILSCVRANSNSGTIGFLSSRQRMNVALTRAKKAVYILAHVESITISNDWHALVSFADRNKAITVVTNNYKEAVKSLRKPITTVSVQMVPAQCETTTTAPTTTTAASAPPITESFNFNPVRAPIAPHNTSLVPAASVPPVLEHSLHNSHRSQQLAPQAQPGPSQAVNTSSSFHKIPHVQMPSCSKNVQSNLVSSTNAASSSAHHGNAVCSRNATKHLHECIDGEDASLPKPKRIKVDSPPSDPRIRKNSTTQQKTDHLQSDLLTTSKDSTHSKIPHIQNRTGTEYFKLSDVSSASSRSNTPDPEQFEQHDSSKPELNEQHNNWESIHKPSAFNDSRWKSLGGQKQRTAHASAKTICNMRNSTGCDPRSIAEKADRPSGHTQQRGRSRKTSLSSTIFGKKRH